ncbi:hypothetical protein D3C77_492690 [compost metagenome]
MPKSLIPLQSGNFLLLNRTDNRIIPLINIESADMNQRQFSDMEHRAVVQGGISLIMLKIIKALQMLQLSEIVQYAVTLRLCELIGGKHNIIRRFRNIISQYADDASHSGTDISFIGLSVGHIGETRYAQ